MTILEGMDSDVKLSDLLRPIGASVNVERMHVTENPKIPKKVDRIVADELKAREAAHGLYDLGLDVYKVAMILSSGALGLHSAQKNGSDEMGYHSD